MNPFFLLFLNASILSVNAYFYTLLPLTVISHDQKLKAYCPWNQTSDQDLSCVLNEGVMGYYHGTVPTNPGPDPSKFLNPSLQKWTSKDHCAELKKQWDTHKSTKAVCNKYSYCFSVGEGKSVCSCQSGFFGDPYQGCHQHCFTDDDCFSPMATCYVASNSNEPHRCVCKEGYTGDGVMCYKSPCGTDRRAKCGEQSHQVCVPTGPKDEDYKCVYETGYYLDHTKKCVPEHTVKKNTVITLVGKSVKDGSRVEVGSCLSFVLNDGTKSIFFHKNSGDSVYVKKVIKNENEFSIFFTVTEEITAYSKLKDESLGLTKLYSMTNTFEGCKFGRARVFDPSGHEYLLDDPPKLVPVERKVDPKGTQTRTEGIRQVRTTPETHGTSTLQLESSLDLSGESFTYTPDSRTAHGKNGSENGKVIVSLLEKTKLEEQRQSGKRNLSYQSQVETVMVEVPNPVVEVYVRELSEDEKAGGLPKPKEPETAPQPETPTTQENSGEHNAGGQQEGKNGSEEERKEL